MLFVPEPDIELPKAEAPGGTFMRLVGRAVLDAAGSGRVPSALAVAVVGGHVEILLAGDLNVRVDTGSSQDLLNAKGVSTWLNRRLGPGVTIEAGAGDTGRFRRTTGGVTAASAVRVSFAADGDSAPAAGRARFVLIDERSVAHEIERAAVVGRRPAPRGEFGPLEAIPIVIDGPSLSRTHLACVVRDGVLLVRDLGSRNGTAMEHADVLVPVPGSEWTVVPSGATLVLGGTRLAVRVVRD